MVNETLKIKRKDYQYMEFTTNLEEQRQLLAAVRSGDIPCERSTALWTKDERMELEG